MTAGVEVLVEDERALVAYDSPLTTSTAITLLCDHQNLPVKQAFPFLAPTGRNMAA
jgi:hypothetical protein